jgi:O-antigen/teichoic acid export membrane protein
MKNITEISFFKRVLSFSFPSVIGAIIAFISTPLITRTFSPEEFGKINLFTLLVGISTILVGLSLDQSYFRFFKEKNDGDRKLMLTQLISIIVFSFTIFLITTIFFGKTLSIYIFGEYNFLIIHIALPVTVFMTILLAYKSIYFRMNEKALSLGILTVSIIFTNKLFLIISAFYDSTYTSAIALTTLGISTIAISCKIIVPKSFDINISKISYKQIKPYLKYSIPLLPVALIIFFNDAIIRLLLKNYLSYSKLGIYSATISIAALISLVRVGFTTYWAPFMYSNYKTETEFIKKIHSIITFIIICFAFIIILSSDTLFLLLGPQYRIGKPIFALLLISPVVYTISETTCYGIYISKKTHLQFYSTLISFVFCMLSGFLLIPEYGLLGAGISNAVGGLIFFILRTYFGLKKYNSAEKIKRTFLSIFILVLTSTVYYYWITDIIIRNSIIVLLFLIVIYMYIDIIRKFISMIRENFISGSKNGKDKYETKK